MFIKRLKIPTEIVTGTALNLQINLVMVGVSAALSCPISL